MSGNKRSDSFSTKQGVKPGDPLSQIPVWDCCGSLHKMVEHGFCQASVKVGAVTIFEKMHTDDSTLITD